MKFEQFEILAKRFQQSKPRWFMLEADRLASAQDVTNAQDALGLNFPIDYIRFLKKFGGGYFAFVNIFSVDPAGEWYIVTMNQEIGRRDFLAISDNGTGDYYGFLVKDVSCAPGIVFLDHENQQIKPTKYPDILTFIVQVGLNA